MASVQFTAQFDDFAFKLSSVTESDFIAEARAVAATVFPEWDTEKEGDVGFFALRIYIKAIMQGISLANAWAQEFNIFTAREESSVISHARRLGFDPPSQTPARVDLIVDLPSPLDARDFEKFELQVTTRNTVGPQNEVFFENEFAFSVGASVPQVVVSMIAGKSETQEYTASAEDFQTVILEKDKVLDDFTTVEFLAIDWTEVESLVDSIATDKHFTTALRSDGRTEIGFGDGSTGERPPEGITGDIGYRVGGGIDSNVPATTLDYVNSSPAPDPSSVSNPLKATGGLDRDTADVIAKKATDNVRQRELLGTLKEVSTYAENFDGVARATSQLVGALVLTYIYPDGGGAATSALKDALQETIEERLVLGYTSSVNDTIFTVPTIEVEFDTKEGFVSAQIEAAVLADINTLLNPLTTITDESTRRVSFLRAFGQTLFVNEIRDVLNNRPEVEKDFNVIFPASDITTSVINLFTNVGATISVTSRNTRTVGFLTPG